MDRCEEICTKQHNNSTQNSVGKHSLGYYPGELPQPGKAGQHSNLGNTENTTKILLEKKNPKAHNHQIHQG